MTLPLPFHISVFVLSLRLELVLESKSTLCSNSDSWVQEMLNKFDNNRLQNCLVWVYRSEIKQAGTWI